MHQVIIISFIFNCSINKSWSYLLFLCLFHYDIIFKIVNYLDVIAFVLWKAYNYLRQIFYLFWNSNNCFCEFFLSLFCFLFFVFLFNYFHLYYFLKMLIIHVRLKTRIHAIKSDLIDVLALTFQNVYYKEVGEIHIIG